MAIGTLSSFKIYEPELYGGMYEGLNQVTTGFNAGSNNCIQLVQNESVGHFMKESFYKQISGLIAHRDVTSVAAVSSLPMTHDELVNVKVNKRIGPVEMTYDAFKKVGEDTREFSFQLGKQIAEEKAKNFINTAILAVETAISGQASVIHDATSAGINNVTTVSPRNLNAGLKKFGDFAPQIQMWVMHSSTYFDLVDEAIASNVYDVGGIAIKAGTPGTLGRPVLVIDAPALTDANGSLADTYNILGLVPGAVTVSESEDQDLISLPVAGKANLTYIIQGEYAYNVGIKGFKWDVANGSSNPSDATLGTSSNWDLAVSHVKLGPGIRIVTN